MKPARTRPLAEGDLVERTRHYLDAGGTELAARFFETAVSVLRSAEEMPGIGSPVLGEIVGIPGLRRVGVDGFPCGWFYLERSDHLDVVRLLADRQDLELILGDTT